MESPKAKRHKFRNNSIAANYSDSLTSICDWSKSTAIAIKHHENVQTSTEFTYTDLALAKFSVSQILGDAETSLFIGIASNIPSYCLPALMLGVMSGGHAFVCLPPSPQEVQKICESLRILHIFSSENATKLEVALDFQIHRKNLLLLRIKNPHFDLFEPTTKLNIFAYAIGTSGSTGDPKIVSVTHRSIVPNIVDLKRILRLSESDTIAQITPITFDPSVIEIFLSLSCGASLLTMSQELKNDPKTLLKLIVDSRVSVLQSTPSLLLHRWSSEQLRQSILGENSNLRILMLGGENLPSERVLINMRAPENRTKIFDVYGITEVSCWASIREILPHDRTRILGEALSETIFEVRDEAGRIVEEGEGIVHIGSNSRICAVDDEEITRLTIPVFRNTGDTVAIDRKGLMTLRGRSGRRVKRYGTRLNLTKLESHVLQLPSVESCYALFTERNQSLHLFFTTVDRSFNEKDKFDLETSVLSHATKLPDAYRPDKVSLLDRFELTSNGKICRNFLQKFSAKISRLSSSRQVNGETKIDEIFANIWKRSLPIDRDSGFLDLGGTSVMALRIASELGEESGRDFPELVGRLLRNESLASCRSYLSRHALKLSKTVAQETGTKEAFVDRSSESKIDREFSRGGKKPTGSPKNITNAEIAWQKCRGRSSFPPEIKAEKPDWLNVEKIRPWKVYSLGKCVDASPTVFAYPGGKDYVTVGSHSGIICTVELSYEKCPDHWEITLPDRVEASVLVLNEFRAVVGAYDGYVYCVHLKSGEIFWKFKTGDAVKCTAVLCSRGRNIFFGSYDRRAYCVSLENGSKVWEAEAGGGSVCATPWVHRELDAVLFATLDGTCASLKQSSGEVIWLNKLDYPIFSAPVILENGVAIFCDVSGKLNGFCASTGEKTWSVEIDGTVFSHLVAITEPTTHHQSLLFASKNQKVYRLDCSSREETPVFRLAEDLGASFFSTPWSNGKVIALVGTDGELKLLDFVTGKLLNSFKLGGDVFSSPIIHEDFIVVGCRDNNLYVLTCSDRSTFDRRTALPCT